MADWFEASLTCAVTDAAIVTSTHRIGRIVPFVNAWTIKAIKPLKRAAIIVNNSSGTP